MKSQKLLQAFSQYCIEHPSERFWQALRNWSRADSIEYVEEDRRSDTFYWENKFD